MNRRILCYGLALAGCLLSAPSRFASPQSKPRTSWQLLNTKVKLFNDYARDFIEFAKSQHRNTLEYEICFGLQNVAERAADHADSASTSLEIYGNVSCTSDRAKIQPVVRAQLSYYVKQLDSEVSEVNSDLSDTKIPAVATTGIRLKDDLRDLKAILNSLQASME